MGQLVWQKGRHHAALRGMGAATLGATGEALGELGVLYGRTRSSAWGHYTLAAGLAFTDPGVCNLEGCDVSTVGVPLVLDAGFEPTDVLGLGLQLFANVNPEAFYGGLALTLQLGWMP